MSILVKEKGDGKKVKVLQTYHVIGFLLLVNSTWWKDVVMPIKCFRKNIMYTLTPFVTNI